MNLNTPRWGQLLLSLTQTVTAEKGHSLVCIPDRGTAEYELQKLRQEFKERFLRGVIRKDRPGKKSTFTVRYFTQETSTVRLF